MHTTRKLGLYLQDLKLYIFPYNTKPVSTGSTRISLPLDLLSSTFEEVMQTLEDMYLG